MNKFVFFIMIISFFPCFTFASSDNEIAMNSYTKWDLLYNPKSKRVFYMKNKLSLSIGYPMIDQRMLTNEEATAPYLGISYTWRNHPVFIYGFEVGFMNYKGIKSANEQHIINVFPVDIFFGVNGRLHTRIDARLAFGIGTATHQSYVNGNSSKSYDQSMILRPRFSLQFKMNRAFSFELGTDLIISQSFKTDVGFGDFDYFFIPKFAVSYHF